jgi:hypothetical protein
MYKSKKTLLNHEEKCPNKVATSYITDNVLKENNYDINMTFLKNDEVNVKVKQSIVDNDNDDSQDKDDSQDNDDYQNNDGNQVLKDILKPKISNSYQEEIDKLNEMVSIIKNIHISDDPNKKNQVIEQLKNTLSILMTQSQNLIKEMQHMSRRNSYFKNNIVLASFILDKCRKDVPETDEEFEDMFN